MKVNLGSGPFHRPGYLNCDEDPEANPQVRLRLPDLPFADESASEIHLSHVLEHLDKWDGLALLKECLRILKPGGTIDIFVPDTLAVSRIYVLGMEQPDSPLLSVKDSDGNVTPWDARDCDWLSWLFFYSPFQRHPHKWSYDERTLTRVLAQAGFTHVRTGQRRDWWECVMHGRKDDGTKPEGWDEVRLRSTVAA